MDSNDKPVPFYEHIGFTRPAPCFNTKDHARRDEMSYRASGTHRVTRFVTRTGVNQCWTRWPAGSLGDTGDAWRGQI